MRALCLIWTLATFAACTVVVSYGQEVPTLRINPATVLHPISRTLTGACLEDVNHEVYGGLYSQMIFGESFAEPAVDNVSGMWRGFTHGSAQLSSEVDRFEPFVGSQSQQLSFTGGAGAVGIENRGLNRQGLGLVANKPYEGHLWARADSNTPIVVSLASGDGSHPYASQNVAVTDAHWHRYDFVLTPTTDDAAGRYEIRLSAPGTVHVGYVFLQPGPWGRFHNLSVRRDAAEALIDEGITVIRYGGSMVNEPAYRWKNMIGDRDHRRPYRGHWYPQSSNGWGIMDFLNFAEAAGVMPVVDLNVDETPADIAVFLQYVNGPADSPWGRQRVADGHPDPYHLSHIELGNEERIDQTYFDKFAGLAKVIWGNDPGIILTVGDFEYSKPIVDPMHLTGATSGITSLSAQQQIMAMAKRYRAEVWFDVHVWSESPPPSVSLRALPTYVDAIDKIADGAKHHVVVYELNANNHAQRRALANAEALLTIEQDGRLPVVCSANCLQIDGQNSNGWDQGLMFLTPQQVWLQPPGYVSRMLSRHRGDRVIESTLDGDTSGALQAVATSDAAGRVIGLQVLNTGNGPATVNVELAVSSLRTFTPVDGVTIAADLSATNTAAEPQTVAPRKVELTPNHAAHTFAPHSLTILSYQSE